MAKLSTPRRRKMQQAPILIVEDNADQWLIIRSVLTQCFPEVEPIWINNTAQTISYLQTHSQSSDKLPRLVLSDLYLPRREDGWALLEFIKTHPFSQRPLAVILSSSKDVDDIMKAYSFGIASYIIKPETYHQWLNCFYTFRRYWWEVVVSPLNRQQSAS